MAKRKMIEPEVVENTTSVEEEPTKVMTVACERLNVRSKASTESEILKVLNGGINILVNQEVNGWCKIADGEGYVMAKFLR